MRAALLRVSREIKRHPREDVNTLLRVPHTHARTARGYTSPPTIAGPPSAGAWEGDAKRVNIYADFTVYKGKGALTVKMIKPTWERVGSGTGLRIARDGTLLLEFAASRGEREYDWEGKVTFALSATECGEVLEAVESNQEKQFFHDPNKMGADEGLVTKTLRVSPARESGYFFSLFVSNKAAETSSRLDTIVSNAEMRVIKSVMDFAIPRLLGFDEMFAGAPDIRESTPTAPVFNANEPPF